MGNKQAINALLNGIDMVVKKELIKAPMDKTFTGLIKNIKSENKYDVLIDQKIYNDIPSIFYNLKLNDTVKVKIPQGQYSQMYIEGKINLDIVNSLFKEVENLKNSLTILNDKNNELEQRIIALENKNIIELRRG